jgi:hypothetical protein
MPEHPKIAALDARSAWTFVCSIAYANRNLTDGFVPDAVAFRLADHPQQGEPSQVIDELAAAGLWEVVDGGYQIHDYPDYQRSKEEVRGTAETLSEKRARAGRAGAAKRWQGHDKTWQRAGEIRGKNALELEQEQELGLPLAKEKRPQAAAYQPFQQSNHEPQLDRAAALELARLLAQP